MSSNARPATEWLLRCIAAVSLAGCASDSRDVQLLTVGDFSQPSPSIRADVVEMSRGVLAGPEVATEDVEIAEGHDGTEMKRSEVIERLADGQRVVDATTPRVVTEKVPVGEDWPVDALVGQINGRPLFADEFFAPIADQLMQIAANPDRVAGREQFVRIVRAHFKQTVDSELVVAEAESQLTPEQQQGVLAWLKSIQEATIAERGGSLASAEASLQAEEDKTLDEFMRQRREVSLALRLLNQRIEPRAIVSWREVLQAYERDSKIYNPPARINVGRLKYDNATEADKIERVKALAAEGKPFSEIAKEMGAENGGYWGSADLPAEGIDGLSYAPALKEQFKVLKPDQIGQPLQQSGFTSWYAVISITQPPARSIYDRDLQLQITKQLQDVRRAIERQRYISSLRTRWVTDDIIEMEERLITFGFDRYWR